MSGTITTVTRELTRYKLDLVGTQEGRWDKGGTVRPAEYIFFCGKEIKLSNRSKMFVKHRLVSVVKRVEVVSDRMIYIYIFIYLFIYSSERSLIQYLCFECSCTK